MILSSKSFYLEAAMLCPYCHHKNHLELDMHSDGYSPDLLECTECGALLNVKGTLLGTVHGPTEELYQDVAL